MSTIADADKYTTEEIERALMPFLCANITTEAGYQSLVSWQSPPAWANVKADGLPDDQLLVKELAIYLFRRKCKDVEICQYDHEYRLAEQNKAIFQLARGKASAYIAKMLEKFPGRKYRTTELFDGICVEYQSDNGAWVVDKIAPFKVKS